MYPPVADRQVAVIHVVREHICSLELFENCDCGLGSVRGLDVLEEPCPVKHTRRMYCEKKTEVVVTAAANAAPPPPSSFLTELRHAVGRR